MIRLARIFVGSSSGWSDHTQAAYAAHQAAMDSGLPVIPLNIGDDVAHRLGKDFTGLDVLLQRGWGFVVFVSRDHTALVVHEGKDAQFTFTTTNWPPAVSSCLTLFAQLCRETDQYQGGGDVRSRLDKLLDALPR